MFPTENWIKCCLSVNIILIASNKWMNSFWTCSLRLLFYFEWNVNGCQFCVSKTITSKDKLKCVPGRNGGCEIGPEWCPQNQSDLLLKYSKASAIPFNQPQPIATTIQDCKTFLMGQNPAYLKVLIHTRSQKKTWRKREMVCCKLTINAHFSKACQITIINNISSKK